MKFLQYVTKARNLIMWGVIVGLVLGVGVWLVVLNDLGARLATVGAFIAAILTPLLAFVANNFISQNQKSLPVFKDSEQDSTNRNSRIIVISALVAFIVAVGVVWATPRVISAVENYFYYSHDTEAIDPAAITIKNNTNMKDGDTATVVLPSTRHKELKVQFTFKNQTTTTLCANAATLKVKGPTGTIDTIRANQEKSILMGEDVDQKQLSVRLVFLPETDPSCRLDVSVSSALYHR